MCFDGIPRLRFASKKTPAEGTIVKRDPTGKSFVVSEDFVKKNVLFALCFVIECMASRSRGPLLSIVIVFTDNLIKIQLRL